MRDEGEGGDGEDEDEGDLVQKEMRMGGMLDFGQQYAVRPSARPALDLLPPMLTLSFVGREQVCAAGGLVGYLTKVKARGELRGFEDEGGLRVGGVESLTPCVRRGCPLIVRSRSRGLTAVSSRPQAGVHARLCRDAVARPLLLLTQVAGAAD